MMDHLSRAATFDWQVDTLEDQGRPADRRATPDAEAPRIGTVETLVSLRCPVGRPRGETVEAAGRYEPAAIPNPRPHGPIASLPGCDRRPCAPSPDTGPPETVAARRPGDITATL